MSELNFGARECHSAPLQAFLAERLTEDFLNRARLRPPDLQSLRTPPVGFSQTRLLELFERKIETASLLGGDFGDRSPEHLNELRGRLGLSPECVIRERLKAYDYIGARRALAAFAPSLSPQMSRIYGSVLDVLQENPVAPMVLLESIWTLASILCQEETYPWWHIETYSVLRALLMVALGDHEGARIQLYSHRVSQSWEKEVAAKFLDYQEGVSQSDPSERLVPQFSWKKLQWGMSASVRRLVGVSEGIRPVDLLLKVLRHPALPRRWRRLSQASLTDVQKNCEAQAKHAGSGESLRWILNVANWMAKDRAPEGQSGSKTCCLP